MQQQRLNIKPITLIVSSLVTAIAFGIEPVLAATTNSICNAQTRVKLVGEKHGLFDQQKEEYIVAAARQQIHLALEEGNAFIVRDKVREVTSGSNSTKKIDNPCSESFADQNTERIHLRSGNCLPELAKTHDLPRNANLDNVHGIGNPYLHGLSGFHLAIYNTAWKLRFPEKAAQKGAPAPEKIRQDFRSYLGNTFVNPDMQRIWNRLRQEFFENRPDRIEDETKDNDENGEARAFNYIDQIVQGFAAIRRGFGDGVTYEQWHAANQATLERFNGLYNLLLSGKWARSLETEATQLTAMHQRQKNSGPKVDSRALITNTTANPFASSLWQVMKAWYRTSVVEVANFYDQEHEWPGQHERILAFVDADDAHATWRQTYDTGRIIVRDWTDYHLAREILSLVDMTTAGTNLVAYMGAGHLLGVARFLAKWADTVRPRNRIFFSSKAQSTRQCHSNGQQAFTTKLTPLVLTEEKPAAKPADAPFTIVDQAHLRIRIHDLTGNRTAAIKEAFDIR